MLSESEFKINDGVLFLNGKAVNLPRKVEQILVVDDNVIYRFVVNGKNVTNRNVGALDFNGNMKWVIEEVDSKAIFKEYDQIYLNDNNELIACCYIGMDFIVDLSDGTIANYGIRKF